MSRSATQVLTAGEHDEPPERNCNALNGIKTFEPGGRTEYLPGFLGHTLGVKKVIWRQERPKDAWDPIGLLMVVDDFRSKSVFPFKCLLTCLRV